MNDPIQPFANGSPDRRHDGTFAPGNSAAKGRSRPFSARVNAWRRQLAEAVTDDDIKAVAEKLISEARRGERWAIETTLRYCIGDPERAELAERLCELESRLEQRR
jgi:hypothetical protein